MWSKTAFETSFTKLCQLFQSQRDYERIVQDTMRVIQTKGWAPSASCCDASGCVDFVGAFAAAMGAELQAEPNMSTFHALNEWLRTNLPFRRALVSDYARTRNDHWPEDVPALGVLVLMNDECPAQQDALDFLAWLLDVLEVHEQAMR